MRWNSLSKLGLVDPDMYKAHWPLFGFFAIKSCLFSAIGKLKFFYMNSVMAFARILRVSVSFLNVSGSGSFSLARANISHFFALALT